MTVVHLQCKHGHKIALDVSRPAGLVKLCKQGKRVCPSCKPEEAPLSPFQPDEHGLANDKRYTCKHGHITEFTAFTSGMINVTWGSEFENIPGVPEDVQEWVEQGILKCRHMKVDSAGRRRKCSCKLKPLDDAVLAYPNRVGIKTRTRVGDIWDKEGYPEPKAGRHELFRQHGEEDARFVDTEFSKRNKRRLRKLRRRRQTEAAGEVLKRPTDRRSDDKLNKGRAIRGSRQEYD